MEKNIFKPYLTLVALLILTSLALAFTVDVELSDQAGVVLELPDKLDDWVGNELRFCHNPGCYETNSTGGQYYIRNLELPDICPDCGEDLYKMSWAEYDALPHDTLFVKSAYTNENGGRVFVSIVLSGAERSSIHRPQRCLVGQGQTISGDHVIEVPLAGRKPVRVMVLETEQLAGTAEKRHKYTSYYAYWFVGQDRETPSHLARMFWLGWDRVFRSVAHKWAYIAVSGIREEGNDEYDAEIADFVEKLYPHLLVENDNLRGTP
ncbi:MAG: EpsI family protein [Kiritimatiellales bacterium]|nr:EpsI family protein [Kiritimatiellales bacterium]